MTQGTWILFKKECLSYFSSSLAYLISAFFLFLMGWLFFNSIMMSGDDATVTISSAVIRPIFANMNFIFLILAPIITMKSFAEEKKEQTLSVLLLSKLSSWDIILGKIFGAFSVILFMMLLTFIFPLILAFSGYHDWAIVFTGYLGTLLNAFVYISVGVLISSLTENQIVSALISFCVLLFLMILAGTGGAVDNFMLSQMISYLSMATHFEPFSRGVIRSSDVLYYMSFFGFSLWLTSKSLESRHW